MKKKQHCVINVGDVWSTETAYRRVVAVYKGRIVYSVGSDRNRDCKTETFRRYVRNASLIYAGELIACTAEYRKTTPKELLTDPDGHAVFAAMFGEKDC